MGFAAPNCQEAALSAAAVVVFPEPDGPEIRIIGFRERFSSSCCANRKNLLTVKMLGLCDELRCVAADALIHTVDFVVFHRIPPAFWSYRFIISLFRLFYHS
jgi:hypothetical protein